MQKIFASTTDTIIFILTLALIAFTALKITEAKDFMTFLLMVASFKFGKSQFANPDAPLMKSIVQG